MIIILIGSYSKARAHTHIHTHTSTAKQIVSQTEWGVVCHVADIPKENEIHHIHWGEPHDGCSCSMAAADGERILTFPLVCPNIAHCVSFSAPDIYSLSKEEALHWITVDVAVDHSFLVIRCRKYSPSRWLQQILTTVATDVPGGMTRVAWHFWRTCPADNSRNMF